MKKQNSFKKMTGLFIALSLSVPAFAQQEITIANQNPGDFESNLTSQNGGSFSGCSKVTVTGEMNKADFDFIKGKGYEFPENAVLDFSAVILKDESGVATDELFEESFDGFKTPKASVTIILPESVTRTANKPFGGLEAKVVSNTITWVGPYCFAWARGLGDFTLFEPVTDIRGSAFAYCDNADNQPGLTSIVISKNIRYIGFEAFSYCTMLKSMTIKATTPPEVDETLGESIGSHYGAGFKPTLYVPEASVDAYKAVPAFTDVFGDNILPIDESTVSTGKSISENNDIWACFSGDELSVTNLETGMEVIVNDLQGRTLSKTTADGNIIRIGSLPANTVYLVNIVKGNVPVKSLKVVRL